MRKTYSPLSEIKTAQNAVHLLAGVYAYENKLEDCFILNQAGNVSECISSNVFAVFGNKIITPFISEACLPGIMRGLLLDRSEHIQLKAGEGVLCIRDIEEADEVFLTNMIKGIIPVSSFHGRTYSVQTAERLIQVINDKLIRTF
jgi:branched-chain amino acid aminotransferase